jgi:hypothetical protein
MKERTIMRSVFKRVFCAAAILPATFFVSCHTDKEHTGDGVRLTYESKCVKVKNGLVTIDMRDMMNRNDTLDAREIIGASYVLDDTARLELKADAAIVKAEKVTCYYPTVWSCPGDEVMQFVYLFNLGFVDVMPLNVVEDVIEYPVKGVFAEKAYKDHFGKITKSEILSSLEKVPEEYAGRNTPMAYEYNSWKSEKRVWRRIACGYSPGALIDDDHEPFDVDKYEIMLVVTFKNDKGEFKKIFRDEAIIGN